MLQGKTNTKGRNRQLKNMLRVRDFEHTIIKRLSSLRHLDEEIKLATLENRAFVRHVSSSAEKQGFVEMTAKVSKDASIGRGVIVTDYVQIEGRPKISGYGKIMTAFSTDQKAWKPVIEGDVQISGKGRIYSLPSHS